MEDTPTAILRTTKNQRTRQSMLMGSALEGGWKPPYPVGDSGTSFGPFQMHEGGMLTSLNLTPKQAETPSIAAPAILPAYQKAVNQISDRLWQTDPKSAAVQAAQIAERPAAGYAQTRGNATINMDWKATQGVLAGKKSTGGMPPTDVRLLAAGDNVGGGINWLKGLADLFFPSAALATTPNVGTDLKKGFERLGLILFGAALILVGVIVLAYPAAKTGVREATGIGRTFGLGGGSPEADVKSEARYADKQADRTRRQNIANRSLDLGERNYELKRQKEARLAGKIEHKSNPQATSGHTQDSKWHREHVNG
jgi:hypothetical protein